MLPIREVTYAKCYFYEMLPRQIVLYKMLLYENVLYEMLLILLISLGIINIYKNINKGPLVPVIKKS